MGAEIDPDPERADIGSGLEHPDAGGGLRGVGGKRQRQSADAATDDDQLHKALRSTRQLISHIPMVLWNLPNRAAGCNIACASKDVH
jgi:hypothetical protein